MAKHTRKLPQRLYNALGLLKNRWRERVSGSRIHRVWRGGNRHGALRARLIAREAGGGASSSKDFKRLMSLNSRLNLHPNYRGGIIVQIED